MHEFSLTFRKGHLFVDFDGEDWLVDTGAPSSFGARNIEIGEHDFSISSSYMGLTAEQISGFVDHNVTGLMGADVLNTFDILIDIKSEKVSFTSGETLLEGETLVMTDFMGIPIIRANIGGQERGMFFDTGARISYYQDKSLETFPRLGRVSDFYPGFGEFQTETYRVEASLGAIQLELCCGSLPEMLGMTLMMSGVTGIIGNEILVDHVAGYFPRRQALVIA